MFNEMVEFFSLKCQKTMKKAQRDAYFVLISLKPKDIQQGCAINLNIIRITAWPNAISK